MSNLRWDGQFVYVKGIVTAETYGLDYVEFLVLGSFDQASTVRCVAPIHLKENIKLGQIVCVWGKPKTGLRPTVEPKIPVDWIAVYSIRQAVVEFRLKGAL